MFKLIGLLTRFRGMLCLTGTPGTGKTTISNRLSEEFEEVVHLNNLIQRDFDQENEISVSKKELRQKYSFNPRTLVEGHLSHLLEPEYCIVLRCHPKTLKDRLSNRGYSDQKINENCMAEALDHTLQSAIANCQKVYELDTTDKSVEECQKEIKRAVGSRKQRKLGKDWSTGYI